MNHDKKNLVRWCGSFLIGNVILFWLLGMSYLDAAPWIASKYLGGNVKITLTAFLLMSYLAQLAILAMLPGLLIFLIIFVYPRRLFVFMMAIGIMTLGASLLLADAVTYKLFHFHLQGIVLNFIFDARGHQILGLSKYEYISCFLLVTGILLYEVVLAYYSSSGIWRAGKWIVISIGLLMYVSYLIIFFSMKENKGRVFLETARAIPLYADFLFSVLPITTTSRFSLDRAYEIYLIQPDQPNKVLRYPLHPLQFTPPKQQLNVVMIVIDAWRFDMLNKNVVPHIAEFAKSSSVFKQHFSGGNATGPGIFSLLYGLPSNYWTSMAAQQRGPILIDELLRRNYDIKILASAGLYMPAFDHTVFSAIHHLQKTFPGKSPYDRDVMITQAFKQYINQITALTAVSTKNAGPSNSLRALSRLGLGPTMSLVTTAANAEISQHQEPFFSFLFYDAAHGYCAVEQARTPWQPVVKNCDRIYLTDHTDPLPYLNRYKNALRLVDQQVGLVIDELKAHQMLDRTVVIITGDHGEEFNDNHLNDWGHASNFTHFQVQTPLIVYWPNRSAKKVEYVTTHFDMVPTLMENLLGCQSPAENYSQGQTLWAPKNYPYRIVESYVGIGVIENNQITTIYPTGTFQLTGLDNQPLDQAQLNMPIIHSLFRDFHRFYAAEQ